MDTFEKLMLVSALIAMLGGLFALDSKIDRQCTPPAVKTRVAV